MKKLPSIDTYCIEALMQDGKALQAGTSHFLGQNFARAFDVQFTNKEGKLEYVWATSWGVSTRLIGALVMAHSDDNGLILPPKLAPIQVVIIPIYKTPSQLSQINKVAEKILSDLTQAGISVKYDNRDTQKPGWKFNEYELKGVPLRIAIGPKDLELGTLEFARRDTLAKTTVQNTNIVVKVQEILDEIQNTIFNKALEYRNKNTYAVTNWDDFADVIENKGGFVLAFWDGTTETENIIKEKTKATIRCIPLNEKTENGKCIYTGKNTTFRAFFARAY